MWDIPRLQGTGGTFWGENSHNCFLCCIRGAHDFHAVIAYDRPLGVASDIPFQKYHSGKFPFKSMSRCLGSCCVVAVAPVNWWDFLYQGWASGCFGRGWRLFHQKLEVGVGSFGRFRSWVTVSCPLSSGTDSLHQGHFEAPGQHCQPESQVSLCFFASSIFRPRLKEWHFLIMWKLVRCLDGQRPNTNYRYIFINTVHWKTLAA